MFRISSFQIVLILVWLISHLTNSMQLAACISTLFNLTQRCDSDNYYYGTTLNYGDELGTEFNYWLMRSMMRSFATNRRFVYMVTHRDWAFDCPQQHGWACYLNFPSCHDSIIEVKDMNFTNTRNPLNIWKYPGPKVAEQEAIRNTNFYPPFYKQVLSVLRDTYEEVVPKGICDFVDEDNIWPSDFGGILTQYLYRLNDNTLRVVDVINHRYDHLLSSSTKPFIGVMLRMNDTNADEMTNSDWLFVADVNQVSNRILEGIALHVQRLQVSHIHDIFIAMDDCKPASELLAFFSPKGYKLFGTCFHTDGKTALESSETSSEHKSHKKGHDLKQDMTHLIFADIAMLRKSSLFIGMIQFNLVRVVHYLRYPHYQNTFNLVAKYNVSELSFFF